MDNTEEDPGSATHGGSATVLEESRKEAAPVPLPASGPELAAMMKIGTRVMRGLDWKWGDQVRCADMASSCGSSRQGRCGYTD